MLAKRRVDSAIFLGRVAITLNAFLLAFGLAWILRLNDPVRLIICVAFVAGAAVAVGRTLETWTAWGPVGRLTIKGLILKIDTYRLKRNVDSAVSKTRRDASAAQQKVLRELMEQIEVRAERAARMFPEARVKLVKRAGQRALTVFEDDSDPTPGVVVMDLFRKLGFNVNTVDEHSDLYTDPRPVWRFSDIKTDYLLVGPKATEKQFIQELHPWESPVTIHVSAIPDDVGYLQDVFHDLFHDLPIEFERLVLFQIWICLRFWQAQGQQRHRISSRERGNFLGVHSDNT